MDVPLIDVLRIGVHLMGVHSMGVPLVGVPHSCVSYRCVFHRFASHRLACHRRLIFIAAITGIVVERVKRTREMRWLKEPIEPRLAHPLNYLGPI